MIAIDGCLKAVVLEKVAALRVALNTQAEEGSIYEALGACAALGRDHAQKSWTLHYEAADRDYLMRADEDALVSEILQLALSSIYSELPGQIQGVLRDSFDDEHLRLENPGGWAEINADEEEA